MIITKTNADVRIDDIQGQRTMEVCMRIVLHNTSFEALMNDDACNTFQPVVNLNILGQSEILTNVFKF